MLTDSFQLFQNIQTFYWLIQTLETTVGVRDRQLLKTRFIYRVAYATHYVSVKAYVFFTFPQAFTRRRHP